MSKYRQVLHDAVNLKSTNRGVKTSNHLVGKYEQTKKGLSYFYPKREVLNDGVHTKPLNRIKGVVGVGLNCTKACFKQEEMADGCTQEM